tara:strand:+ start:1369 stop:1884 length:516 start_codon:yes stop_codon:yes gene_type:complete
MAKSDSFFIRAKVQVDNSTTFQQTTLDLGAYVDALGKSVLRIHNVEWEVAKATGDPPTAAGDTGTSCAWQLTTQSQSNMLLVSDKSIIAKGQLWARNPDTSVNAPAQVYTDSVAPQHYTNGYLVATENIYLGGIGESGWTADDDLTIAIILECTVESMSQASAMALALSQQ